MDEFGRTLKKLRTEAGWRQQDLVDALSGEFARSTLANIESARERPTPRLFELLSIHLPTWAALLEGPYLDARAEGPRKPRRRSTSVRPAGAPDLETWQSGGPFRIESLQFVYTFRHSHSPEEIVEVRRVRATRSGVDSYGLSFTATDHTGFEVEEEALYGGQLVATHSRPTDHHVHYYRRFQFGRSLRRGQVHEFAVRAWVARDDDPDTEISFSVTLPTERVAIHANFLGPDRPRNVWQYGPMAAEDLAPKSADDGGTPLRISDGGNVSAYFTKPIAGGHHGIAWIW